MRRPLHRKTGPVHQATARRGRATIYPIALDRVPGRKGWRYQWHTDEVRPAHNPQNLPVNQLELHIIAKTPIFKEADKVLP